MALKTASLLVALVPRLEGYTILLVLLTTSIVRVFFPESFIFRSSTLKLRGFRISVDLRVFFTVFCLCNEGFFCFTSRNVFKISFVVLLCGILEFLWEIVHFLLFASPFYLHPMLKVSKLSLISEVIQFESISEVVELSVLLEYMKLNVFSKWLRFGILLRIKKIGLLLKAAPEFLFFVF